MQNGGTMNKHVIWCAAIGMAACASYPAPTEHLASAMAAVRGAQEVGVARVPQAELQLEVAQARALMADGKNERADYMTLRAYNDAALALAIARVHAARANAEQAARQADK